MPLLIMDLVLQMKTGCVALVLCLNISVDPPDVIKISPCARMECWIGNFLTAYFSEFLDSGGKPVLSAVDNSVNLLCEILITR
jgi:hypothetical protein